VRLSAASPGGLFAAFQGFISPESFTLLDSIMILCMVVLGGMGHVPGVVLGAVLLTALPEALRYVGPLQKDWLGRYSSIRPTCACSCSASRSS
jgi:branched-chain amino acid transport system permease protein